MSNLSHQKALIITSYDDKSDAMIAQGHVVEQRLSYRDL
jgi:hypothetical protein